MKKFLSTNNRKKINYNYVKVDEMIFIIRAKIVSKTAVFSVSLLIVHLYMMNSGSLVES